MAAAEPAVNGAARHRCPKWGTDLLLPTSADPIALEDLLRVAEIVKERDRLRELLDRLYAEAATPEGLHHRSPLTAELERVVGSWRGAKEPAR